MQFWQTPKRRCAPPAARVVSTWCRAWRIAVWSFASSKSTARAEVDTPEIQSGPVKVQSRKLRRRKLSGMVCKAAGDLWHFGEGLVHEGCARFLQTHREHVEAVVIV